MRYITFLIMAMALVLAAVSAPSVVDAKARKAKVDKALEKAIKSSSIGIDDKLAALSAFTPEDAKQVRGLGKLYAKYLPTAKKPNRIMDKVCDEILIKISKTTDTAITRELHEDVLDVDTITKLRDAYFAAILDDDSILVSDLCVTLASDDSALMRVLSIDELGRRTYDKGFNACMQALMDDSRRVQVAALDSLELYGKDNKDAKEKIITELCTQYMQRPVNRGERLARARKVLVSLGKHDAGSDPNAWLQWWRQRKKENAGKDVKGREDKGGTAVRTVWDIDTSSTQLIFVIDTSVSMAEPIDVKNITSRTISGGNDEEREKNKRRNKGVDWSKVKTKLDLARADLKLYINMMEDDEFFTIVSYNTTVNIWKETLIPATEKNRDLAHDFLNSLKTGKLTNIYGALNDAMKVAEKAIAKSDDAKEAAKAKKKRKGRKSSTRKKEVDPRDLIPDTIIFLTDGYATHGDYCLKGVAGKATPEQAKQYTKTMNAMLKEIKRRNRATRLTIHAVAVGKQVDKATLKKLAKQNKGDFRELKEGNNKR